MTSSKLFYSAALLVLSVATFSFGSELIPGTPNVLAESVTFSNVASFNGVGDAANTTLASGLVGGYNATEFVVFGELDNSAGVAGTFGSEADIRINNSFNIGGGTGTTYTGTTTIAGTSTLVTPFDPAAATFEFFESFDDDPTIADQTWNTVTVDVFDDSGTPDTVIDGNFALGTIAADGVTISGPGQSPNLHHTGVLGGLDFFTFDIAAGVGVPGSYLNIQTTDPLTGDAIDTEIALYDAAGTLVASDDDGQEAALGGLYSLLSFGDDPLSGDQTPGVDGTTLAAGNYTLVVGPFDAVFAATLGDVEPGIGTLDSRAGDYNLELTHAVPEPSAFLMVLVGTIGLSLLRRRS